MDLSIIIVSYKVKDKLRENLKAIYGSKQDFSWEVFVVDNNSQDGTVEMIRSEFTDVKLIANGENLGFAKANNQAIKQAKGEYILLLNPDMLVFENTLANMLEWMKKNQQAEVAGCHLVDENNNTIKHVRRFPTLSDQLAIVLKLPHLFPNILKKYIREDFDYSQAQAVDSIRGGFFMIRNNGYLLDERYFIWFEEVDFCRQIRQAGKEVWYTPSAECLDYVGQSFKQVGSLKKQMYFRDSMLKYFSKWHPVWQYVILYLAWIPGLVITMAMERIGLKSKAKT